MSLWGATVITNLLSAIPVFGIDLVQFVWGSFSVSNATLNRFFSLHYLLPFILAALVVAHLISLHWHGSNNPNGIASTVDRYAFHPYFTFKDLVTIFAFLGVLSVLVFFYPKVLGHSDLFASLLSMHRVAESRRETAREDSSEPIVLIFFLQF